MENDALSILDKKLKSLERVVYLLTISLKPPVLRDVLVWRGWRYEKPDVRHFCVLKSVRSLSAMNAAIVLGRNGYVQEICVLMRTIAECTTHIHFLIQNHGSEEDRVAARKYLKAFFEDYQRGVGTEGPWAQIKQSTVHTSIGSALDAIIAEIDGNENQSPAAELYKNTYRIFSNYVHARYPECMDLYGGQPGHFYTRGMLKTPKEAEILAVLETHLSTVEICVCTIVKAFHLDGLVESDPAAGQWFKEFLSRIAN